MTTPSLNEITGICVVVNAPLVLRNEHIGTLTNYDSYTHTIAANGGYQSASITHKMSISDLDDWFENGIGRNITVYNRAQQVIWEGFVNQITVDTGLSQSRVGPLMDARNRTWAVYTPLDPVANPPARGPKTTTAIAQDTTSQGRYGILESVLSLGELLPSEAAQVCQSTLNDAIEPETTHDIGSGGEPMLTLDCLGYYEWLDHTYYTDIGASGTVTVSDPTAATGKLQRVIIAANAINSWAITTNYTNMVSNALLCPRYEAEDKTCKAVIEELVVLGEPTNYRRCTFGLYAGRIPRYQIMPTTYEYTYQIKVLSEGARVKTLSGTLVDPWDVLPARWIFQSDFLVGKPMATTMRQDRRSLFIEQVTYTAPYGLQFNGNKVGTSKQILAQMGLGGRAA